MKLRYPFAIFLLALSLLVAGLAAGPSFLVMHRSMLELAKESGLDVRPQEATVDSYLDWLSNLADFSYSSSLEKQATPLFARLEPGEIVEQYFEPNRLAGYCGAIAGFVAKSLRELGFDAFMIDFGIPDGDLTHVTVVWRDAGGKYFIADPTFNGTFVDEAGEPIGIFDIKPDDRFRAGPVDRRDFLLDTRTDAAARRYVAAHEQNCGDENEFGVVACKVPGYSIDTYFAGFRPALEKHGLADGREAFVFLLRQGLFSVEDGLRPETKQDFIDQAKKAGIPLHAEM